VNLLAKFKGSFRDPAGQVYELDSRILRTVTKYGAKSFIQVKNTGLLDQLVDSGQLVPFVLVDDPDTLSKFQDAVYVLEHPQIKYISYPYEWSFSLLKQAALLHLEIALKALEANVSLSDASAYNVQFIGTRPIFIDHLSFKPYTEQEYWIGHQQFCEQFLNPLLLRAKLGVRHNTWFRGTLEGISNEELSLLLKLPHKISLRMLVHVILPAFFQRKAYQTNKLKAKALSKRNGLSKAAYKGLLVQLKNWIQILEPKENQRSTWGDYAKDNTYKAHENDIKASFIKKFMEKIKPALVYDLGCNSGEFSEVAACSGADEVIGFDFDQIAIEKAYARSSKKSLNFLPLYFDAVNPSPDQGWRQSERLGFEKRVNADAILALAFVHHLVIGKNVPLPQAVDWLVSLAPRGIIEFVDKKDETVQQMLSMREDIFFDYDRDTFEEELAKHATIIETCVATKNGRVLYWYQRN
jgi:ribosomal protein L11 methylase PrmA